MSNRVDYEDDEDDTSNYYDLEDKDSKVVGIKELDLATLYPLHPNDVKNGSKYVIVGKPGCLERGTGIIMFNGDIKKVEDIVVGDILMGDDSTPRNVLELCSGYDDMYKIIQSDGETYVVNKGHILSLKYKKNTKEEDLEEKDEIIDIKLTDYIQKDNVWKNRVDGYRAHVDFDTKNIDMDPWMLGAWIVGDTSNIIGTSAKPTYIPSDYKINSKKIRLQLLAGIVDSEGIYNEEKQGYDIFHQHESIIDDIIFVSRSLGLYSYKNKYDEKYGCFVGGDLSTVPFIINHSRCYIKKSEACITNITVEYKGCDNYYGFVLDGNHRFLLQDFTVTHNTGKSTLIKAILYSKKHIFPTGKVHSGTEDSNGFFGEIMPTTFIENGLDLSNLTSIENFKKRQNYSKKYLESRGDYPWSYLIIDDCSSDNKLFKKPIFQELYKNGRHWRMMHLLSLQYSLDIPPPIRVCIDGVFILREANPAMRKKLFENYGSCVDSFADWNDLMDQLTDNYMAMFINNKTTSNSIEDCVSYFKADPNAIPKDWKVGCREYWDFHYDRFDPNFIDPVIT